MRNAGAGKIAVPVKIDGRKTIPILAVQNAAMAKIGARGTIGGKQVDNLNYVSCRKFVMDHRIPLE
ncbi:MAG: hypothetical protein V3V46_04165 [Anaerolineales bacterium]